MHVYRQFIYFLNISIIVGWDKSRGRQFFGRPATLKAATPGILTGRGLFFFFFVFWVADFDTWLDLLLQQIQAQICLIQLSSLQNGYKQERNLLMKRWMPF